MVTKTNLKVAIAHLTSRKRQAVVAVLSVTFGVGLFIFMKSFVGGINAQQADLVFASSAHIRIFNEANSQVPNIIPNTETQVVNVSNAKAIQYTEGIKNAEKVIADLQHNPHILSVTAQVNLPATFKNGSAKTGGVLSGVDVVNEDLMFGMKKFIQNGSWEELDISNNHIVIGRGMAEKLNLTVGSMIAVTSADNVSKNFKIVGIVYSGTTAVDDNKGFIKKTAALQLSKKNQNYATDIQINIRDFEQAMEIARPMKQEVAYKVESWQESNQQLVTANNLRNMISTVVPLVLIIVAGFGIYNIMTMTVNEKIKEIAILKALGFGGKDVIQIFLTQAVLIGIVGAVTGIGLGYLISTIMSKLPISLGTANHLIILFEPKTYMLATGIGLIITIIAGYLPARKAAGVDPVQIIRG